MLNIKTLKQQRYIIVKFFTINEGFHSTRYKHMDKSPLTRGIILQGSTAFSAN